jgi:homoserine dehydrogenase
MAGRLAIIQLGLGGVGQALVRQYLDLSARYPALGYTALGDRTGLIFREGGWANGDLERVLQLKADGLPIAQIAEQVNGRTKFVPPADNGLPDLSMLLVSSARTGSVVVVDATGDRGTYDTLFRARTLGANVVMCNKWPLAVPFDRYEALMAAGGGANRIGFETTVGAALPVIGTLQGLLQTGDEVRRIEASVSGTLGFVFTQLDEGVPFSAAVREAHSLGYTEPDPRDDLSGVDAQRKALILARVLGRRMDMADVRVESVVPPALQGAGLDEFWQRLPEFDGDMAARVEAAASRGNVLRYIATVDESGASAGLAEVPSDGQLGSLRGTESLFVFHTRRYHDQPLSVRGRGAGADVTASGVMSDILSLLDSHAGSL